MDADVWALCGVVSVASARCPWGEPRDQCGGDALIPRADDSSTSVAIAPVLGGKPRSVDRRAALAVGGVRQVVQTEEAVAVIADHTGAAKKGLQAAAIQWDDGANAGASSEQIVSFSDGI